MSRADGSNGYMHPAAARSRSGAFLYLQALGIMGGADAHADEQARELEKYDRFAAAGAWSAICYKRDDLDGYLKKIDEATPLATKADQKRSLSASLNRAGYQRSLDLGAKGNVGESPRLGLGLALEGARDTAGARKVYAALLAEKPVDEKRVKRARERMEALGKGP
ncbi:MAG: hypothetical protein U0229_23660 [Anaeromyxobacter sp.]